MGEKARRRDCRPAVKILAMWVEICCVGPPPPKKFACKKKKLKKALDIWQSFGIMNPALARVSDIAGLCKGSTADSDSVCEGSNPSPAAKRS